MIFPVPCEFINASFPHVSIIRPLPDQFGGALATINSFIADGRFMGQSQQFIETLTLMAIEADFSQRLVVLQHTLRQRK
jgi:hypothetical protein